MCYIITGDTMTLKELRISKGLTQIQVAEMIGLSLRSYKQYENEESKKDTIKYKYIVDELTKYGFIDEEHGILTLDQIISVTKPVFDRYKINYCYLFGSYSTNKAADGSDVDLLVSSNITGMDFYGLAEELREALHKKVDLLNIEQLNNNPELLNEILRDGIKIYG